MHPHTVHQHRNDLQVVDVRDDDERRAGVVPAAWHIPLGQLPGSLDELDRGLLVVTTCRDGRWAEQAARLLRRAGFRAQAMEGGVLAWEGERLPLTAAGGPGDGSGRSAQIPSARLPVGDPRRVVRA